MDSGWTGGLKVVKDLSITGVLVYGSSATAVGSTSMLLRVVDLLAMRHH
jgi:hypothetical protein